MEHPFCIKCLLRELSDEVLLRGMEEALSMIPDLLRTPEDMYEKRLASCRECDELNRGTCMVCGCFVEVRAAYERMHCPDVHAKW